MKILITGGHVTPALAVIDKLKESHGIIFVGRKYALEHEQTLSFEYKQVTARNIKFVDLRTGRVSRILSGRSLLSLLRIPLGFLKSFQIMRQEKPDTVLTFGSYLGVPIAFWAYVFRTPLFTHEQTILPGLANRFIAFFSKKIFVSFPETTQYFKKDKVILTGNPVRESIFNVQKTTLEIEKIKPVIFVAGGSLGSHSVNVHIFAILKSLLKDYIVIHQTGDTKEYKDFEKAQAIKHPCYFPQKHFLEDEIGYVYSITDLFIGRSGANTFFELVALGIPALFIPLPWSGHKEQQKHATLFKNAGCGEIFFQNQKSEDLLNTISRMFSKGDSYKKSVKNLEKFYAQNATDVIIKEITTK